jgi:hypothetical protein
MGVQPPSLLSNALRRYRLTSTVAISLAVHLLAWGIVVWTGALNPAIILAKKPEAKHQLTLDFIKPRPRPETTKIDKPKPLPPSPPKPPKKKKLPNIFVQVDPKQASAKRPEDPDKYSDKNSLAANPKPGNKPKPKIDGSQREIPRTHDITSAIKNTLMPESTPPPIAAKKPLERLKPKPTPPIQTPAIPSNTPNETKNISANELKTPIPVSEPRPKRNTSKQNPTRTVEKNPPANTKKKPAPPPATDTASKPAEYVTPKPGPTPPVTNAVKPQDRKSAKPSPENSTKPNELSPLERAKLRLAKAQGSESQLLPGKATKQDGGAPRKGAPAFNVVLTGYGDYDNKLITAIYNSWVRKNHEARMHQPYRVVVEFELLSSGHVQNMRVKKITDPLTLTIPELICKGSIDEPAPFGQWDEKMKHALGTQRPCRITFSFNIRD